MDEMNHVKLSPAILPAIYPLPPLTLNKRLILKTASQVIVEHQDHVPIWCAVSSPKEISIVMSTILC